MLLSVRAAAVLLALTASPALACPVPDFFESPFFAEVTLKSDYGLDPFTMSVRAGGTSYLRDCNLEGEGLTGYDGDGRTDSRPDVLLHWLGEARSLAFTTDIPEDTLLLIRDPDGRWHFNEDDGEGHNPQVVLPDPVPGDYVIFVSTHGTATKASPGQLIITQPRL